MTQDIRSLRRQRERGRRRVAVFTAAGATGATALAAAFGLVFAEQQTANAATVAPPALKPAAVPAPAPAAPAPAAPVAVAQLPAQPAAEITRSAPAVGTQQKPALVAPAQPPKDASDNASSDSSSSESSESSSKSEADSDSDADQKSSDKSAKKSDRGKSHASSGGS
jgi:type IV secretory pathway VirB10-like protein